MPSDTEHMRSIYAAHPHRDCGTPISWDDLPDRSPLKMRLTAALTTAFAAIRAPLEASIKALEEELQRYRCPIGLDDNPSVCSAGCCFECLRARLADARAKDASAMREALAKIEELVARGFADDRPFTALEDIGVVLATLARPDSQGDGTC